MPSTEVLTPEAVAALSDFDLLVRIRRLRGTVEQIKEQLAAHYEHPSARRGPDWSLRAQDMLKDCQAALDQAWDEGARRLVAKRGAAA